jgi:DinB family protein
VEGIVVATADEIRGQIEDGRAALRAALEGADAGSWEQGPGGDEWSARQAAEHTIGSERSYAGRVADAMLGKAPESVELALASPQEALVALESMVEDVNRVIRYVEDRDLPKTAGETSTIQATMEQMASHAAEHAAQISG